MDNFFEKAKHQVGDVHPQNPDWVWTEWAPGKFDWKSKKGKYHKTQSQNGNQPQQTTSPQNNKQFQPTSPQDGSNQPQQTQQQPSTASKNPQEDLAKMSHDELVAFAKKTISKTLAQVAANKSLPKPARQVAFDELKTRDDYDISKVNNVSDLTGSPTAKPQAKVQYQTKKPQVEMPEITNWTANINGRRKEVSVSGLRKLAADKTDDELLQLLNNTDADWRRRQIAYDEAAARGIDESKINPSGTLQREWDKEKKKFDAEQKANKAVDEDAASELHYDWGGMSDPEAFLQENFPDGDLEWLDPKSERVKKLFDTKTLAGRKRYDTFKDYFQRDPELVPGYLNAQNKVNNLYAEYDEFIKHDSTVLFVSAGGAGAGKTYGFTEIATDSNCPELEPGQDPEDGDWGWVMCNDPEDPTDFRKMLAKYNGTYLDDDGNEHGHIMVFDDADKILTSTSKEMRALMKKITDNDPSKRIFKNPITGENEIFRGRIMVMTNKSKEQLTSDPDAQAIMSRGIASDIQFTRNETMELLANRYEDMKLPGTEITMKSWTEEEKKEFRRDIFDYMMEHVTDADPMKFTPRAFIQLAAHIAPRWKGTTVKKRGNVTVGVDIPWEQTALSIIKSDINDIEKAIDDEFDKEKMIQVKEKLEKKMAEAKKNGVYDKLFGRKMQDIFLFGKDSSTSTNKSSKKSSKNKETKDDEKEVQKAISIDFSSFSLSEAEELLLN